MGGRFHCLLPVRDEADIIGQCLDHLLTWADAIYVFDTGSVDDTWEIVHTFAKNDSRIHLLGKRSIYFNDTLVRGWMFHQARQQMRMGDWFLRVDADEFHHVPPPEFVNTRLRPHETIVYHQYYNFVLRESEVRDWESGNETLIDRVQPIEKRRQWYEVSKYAEPRLCRYRDTMQWPPTVSFPFNAGYIAVERLPIRHYPHRDPVQLERRCQLRAVMMADKENSSNWSRPDMHHWAEQEWRKFIALDDAAGLIQWIPGTALVEVHQTNHLAPSHMRTVHRFTHSWLLPILDRTRPRWPDDAYPQRISPEIVKILEEKLSL